MSVAQDRGVSALPPAQALDLWLDTSRWATFVDGFGAVVRRQEQWPAPGAKVVWKSRPGGRGTVTEKIVELAPPTRVVIDVLDDKMAGRMTVTFEEDDGGSQVFAELDYRLGDRNPLVAVADKIFIRRSMRDSIRRTLKRFAIESEEEAALADGPR